MFRRLLARLTRKKKNEVKTLEEPEQLSCRPYRWVEPRLGSGEIAFYVHRSDYWPNKNEWLELSGDHYRNDSFEDRICDDLCELILSFLDLEDKTRLQWVCPQWRRLIFSKQTEVSVLPFVYRTVRFATRYNDPHMPYDFMERVDLFRIVPVLTVANNIRSITRFYGLDNTEEVMEAIVKFCDRLQAIETDFQVSDELLELFLKKFGPNMKKIIFTQLLEQRQYTKVLKACSGVEVVGRDYIMDKNLEPIFDGEELLTNNLKSFHFSSYQNAERIQTVLKNNRNTLTFVGILIWDSKHLYKEVLNLPKLKKLVINTVGDKAFVEFFEKLSINCHKLRKIRITVDYLSKEMTDWNHFLQALNAINRLKSFKLIHKSSSECDTPFPMVCKSLRALRCLTSLKLIGNCFAIEDQFFDSIDVYMPNIQKLYLQCRNLTTLTTQWLAKLRDLRFVCLCQVDPFVSEGHIRQSVGRRVQTQTQPIGCIGCDRTDP